MFSSRPWGPQTATAENKYALNPEVDNHSSAALAELGEDDIQVQRLNRLRSSSAMITSLLYS